MKVEGMTELDALRWVQELIVHVRFRGPDDCAITINLLLEHTQDIHVVGKSFLDAVIGARRELRKRGFPDGPA